MKKLVYGLLGLLVVLAMAPGASAHFKLLAPQGWIIEADNGDPQKAAPCGGTTANPGMPSNVVNKIPGGQKLHIKVQETVYHPGHYRVALAVNSRAELPPDPMVMTREGARGPQSVSAVIQNPPVIPVLADGLFAHTARSADPFETDIDSPKCTLQIIEFMAEHGLNAQGDFSYHHCADLQITADPKKPIDTRWPGQR
jgi:hypothetical protein